MGRPHRVLNRANAQREIFQHDGDFAAFEEVLTAAVERTQTRLLSYCVMPNHWHLAVWPREDDELTNFVGWLTLTHTQRWHTQHESAGTGHVYQGRFKSFPIQEDEHFYTVARYVERNALRANLVRRAEQWRWSSLYRGECGTMAERELLAEWPVSRPPDWRDLVNAPQTQAELNALHRSIQRGNPFGDAAWSERTARELGLESTLRSPGRPNKRGA
jgi:putative transposase